jgi:hypothetical protein
VAKFLPRPKRSGDRPDKKTFENKKIGLPGAAIGLGRLPKMARRPVDK